MGVGFEEYEFSVGEHVRIVTASGLQFAGPVLNRTSELLTLRDLKTGKRVTVNLRWVRSVETTEGAA